MANKPLYLCVTIGYLVSIGFQTTISLDTIVCTPKDCNVEGQGEMEEIKADLDRQTRTSQQEEEELEDNLGTSQQENEEHYVNLSAIREANKLMKGETFRRETEAATLTLQAMVGFEARIPTGLCQSVIQDERLMFFTQVKWNPGNHYNPSLHCVYTAPVAGTYLVKVTHSQKKEDNRGGLALGVSREKGKSLCQEWVKSCDGLGYVTRTYCKKCEWKVKTKPEHLTDSGECQVMLCEGDKLWLEVYDVKYGAKLVPPCYFSCRLSS